MSIIAKIYPNGEASLYFERRLKKKAFPCSQRRTDRQYKHYLDFKKKFGHSAALEAQNDARRGGRPLGLVTAPISTKTVKTLAPCRGLTRLGARTLRQGAFLIEQSCGKDCVTFGTATIPGLVDGEIELIEKDWSNIVHRFIKRIRYHLAKKGLPAEVIHVTEVQPKRAENSGVEVPHIHFVFQGRKRKGSWAITPKQITKFWAKALQLKRMRLKMFTSSCQLARVKYSVSRYLSKYVAKSRSKTNDAICSSTLRKLSLKQWWGITDSLRNFIKKNTSVLSDSRAQDLWSSHEKSLKSVWEYSGTISHSWDGGEIVFCRFGRLTPYARQKYLRHNLGYKGERVGRINEKVNGLTNRLSACKLHGIDARNCATGA